MSTNEAIDVSDEAAWRARAVDRSTQSTRERAAVRVQHFLDAARATIAENGSGDFTVQEVVDRSGQSLRSFYQYFNGKHELLLALFEEEVSIAATEIEAATRHGDPLERLEAGIRLLYELCAPSRVSVRLFSDFTRRLVVDHRDEVIAASGPLIGCVSSLVEACADAGVLRPGHTSRHTSLLLQVATATEARHAAGHDPLSGDEVWDFCLHAVVPDSVLEARRA